MNEKIALFGVPGSGKTTKCLDFIKEFLKNGYTTKDIVFTTFTTAGIESIKQKLLKNDISIEKDDDFRTLHSLCWRMSGYTSEMATSDDLKVFFRQNNIPYNPMVSKIDENEELGNIYIDFYESMQNKYCVNMEEIPDIEVAKYLNSELIKNDKVSSYDIRQLEYVHRLFIKWKKENNKKMYSDALINIIKNRIITGKKILIVDEAQDLTPLQCGIIEMWCKESQKDYIIISGDDDQTVHEWAGSNPEFLILFSKTADKKIILEKSHRLPDIIAKLCNKISSDIGVREEKIIIGNGKEGKIKNETFMRTDQILKEIEKGKKTFMLFRTNRFMKEFGEMLFENNIPFNYLGERIQSRYTEKFCDVNNALIKIGNNEELMQKEAKHLIETIPTSMLIRGTKTLFRKNEEIPGMIPIDYFKSAYFKNIYANEISKKYLISVMEYKKYDRKNDSNTLIENEKIRNKMLSIKEKIEYEIEPFSRKTKFNLNLGTYHSSKGLEADKVILFLNTTVNFSDINDQEKRALYVACSRPKETLILTIYTNFEAYSENHLYDYMRTKL